MVEKDHSPSKINLSIGYKRKSLQWPPSFQYLPQPVLNIINKILQVPIQLRVNKCFVKLSQMVSKVPQVCYTLLFDLVWGFIHDTLTSTMDPIIHRASFQNLQCWFFKLQSYLINPQPAEQACKSGIIQA